MYVLVYSKRYGSAGSLTTQPSRNAQADASVCEELELKKNRPTSRRRLSTLLNIKGNWERTMRMNEGKLALEMDQAERNGDELYEVPFAMEFRSAGR